MSYYKHIAVGTAFAVCLFVGVPLFNSTPNNNESVTNTGSQTIEFAASPWRGKQGRFRNTSYTPLPSVLPYIVVPRPPLLPPIKMAAIYDIHPDGTVIFR
jgi:hypothetical protein